MEDYYSFYDELLDCTSSIIQEYEMTFEDCEEYNQELIFWQSDPYSVPDYEAFEALFPDLYDEVFGDEFGEQFYEILVCFLE